MRITRRLFIGVLPSLVGLAAEAEDFELARVCGAYESATGGHIGVYAENLLSGRKLEWRPDQRFVMCSTFKASLAALVLARIDAGEGRLSDSVAFLSSDIQEWSPVAKARLAEGRMSVEDMCRAAVEWSDNTCANLLLRRVGGPPSLTTFWRSINDTVSRLDHDEPLLNRTPPGRVENTTTPRAMARTLSRLAAGDVLSPSSRSLLVTWLIESKTGANRLRKGLPATWVVGDKTGNNGKDAYGDLAIAWPEPTSPLVIVVYTRGGRPKEVQVQRAFADVAGRAADVLG